MTPELTTALERLGEIIEAFADGTLYKDYDKAQRRLSDLRALHTFAVARAERGDGVEVLDARQQLTAEYLAMTPTQKWETLTAHGLLGTDEPWIADMRAVLSALPATDTADRVKVSDREKQLEAALREIELISTNYAGQYEQGAWAWGQEMGKVARQAFATSPQPTPHSQDVGLANCVANFRAAVARYDWIVDRLAQGQQFNCYEHADEYADEDDDGEIEDEDREYSLCVGPINDARVVILDISGKAKADLIETAFKLAALNATTASPEAAEGVERSHSDYDKLSDVNWSEWEKQKGLS